MSLSGNENWLNEILSSKAAAAAEKTQSGILKKLEMEPSISTSSSYTSLFNELVFDTPINNRSTCSSGATSIVTSPLMKPDIIESLPNGFKLDDDRQMKPKKKRAPRKRLTQDQKQAHNKIEKRYRININTKIANLQSIIPGVNGEKPAFFTADKMMNDIEENEVVPRLNKSVILDKAIDYILGLQRENNVLNKQVEFLKQECKAMGKDYSEKLNELVKLEEEEAEEAENSRSSGSRRSSNSMYPPIKPEFEFLDFDQD